MAIKRISLKQLLLLLLLLLFILFLICRYSSCKCFCSKDQKPVDSTKFVKTVGWNVLFKPATSQGSKDNAIADIKESVKKFYIDYNNTNGTDFNPQFDPVVWCPCDSSLYNFSFHCVNGAGESISSPPPRPKTPGSGDLVDVLYISNNSSISELHKTDPTLYGPDSINKNSITIKPLPIDNSKILALIDAGIDTALFKKGIKDLIWNDIAGQRTLFNFLPGQPLYDFSDSGRSKHGSAVTALALKAMEGAAKYPRLMILKALDKNDVGSIFSVSCALSYATQKNANVVNASLGYYGDVDSVLQHYIMQTNNHQSSKIWLFLAAGNTVTDYPHRPSKLCNGGFNQNQLTAARLFYPACFNKQFSNITSVTQVNNQNADASCFYQNYSNEYVNLGVQNKDNCCAFKVDFRQTQPQFYEGSSFATPVASGKRMLTLLSNSTEAEALSASRLMINAAPQKRVTINGNFIIYSEH